MVIPYHLGSATVLEQHGPSMYVLSMVITNSFFREGVENDLKLFLSEKFIFQWNLKNF